jgi:hypothetical protein
VQEDRSYFGRDIVIWNLEKLRKLEVSITVFLKKEFIKTRSAPVLFL